MALNPRQWTTKTTEALNAAMQDALSRGNPEVTVDHVLVALMSQTETIVAPLLAKVGVASTMIRDRSAESLGRQPVAQGGSEPRMSRELTNKLTNADKYRAELKDDFLSVEHLLLAMNDKIGVGSDELLVALKEVRGSHRVSSADPESQFQALDKYSVDLTARARDGKIDPVIGRDEEIRRVIQVLSRRTKNNPVLIGEPGVGKTAIVEGLARRIHDGDVPEGLKGKRLVSLDLASIDRKSTRLNSSH